MPVTRAKKSEQLAELKSQFAAAKSVTFAQYGGVTMKNLQQLRRDLRKVDGEVVVAKRTLIKLAAKEALNVEVADTAIPGQVAAIFSRQDEIAGPQTVFEFAKKNTQVKLTGGVLEGFVLDAAQINQLATLPTRDQLLGQLVSVMVGPIRGMAVAGNQVIAGFARILSEIAKKQA